MRDNEELPSESTSVGALPSDVETIASMEAQALGRRTHAERIGERLVQSLGSLPFVVAQIAWITGWIALNLGAIPAIAPFDPFPFGVLTLLLTAEAVFIGIFVLISQNRMARDANRRAHLTLQVGILVERETTEILRIVSDLARGKGMVASPRGELEKRTHLGSLAREIEEKLPER